MEHCLKLEKTATIPKTNEIQKDIIAKDLFDEIDILKSLCQVDNHAPLSVLNYLASNSVLELYPNLVKAYRILLGFPISVASG